MAPLQKFSVRLTEWFPVWIVGGCLWSWFQPELWVWFQAHISLALGVIMLGMGLTLTLSDFVQVMRMPKIVALGVFAHFFIMPLAGYFSAHFYKLDTGFAIGLILVGCCPCGTASNVICFLSKANVALSVLLTMCSTFAAVIMTPLLTQWLAGAYLPIDGWGLFKSMLEIVLLPTIAGLLINTGLDKLPINYRNASRGFINIIGPLLSVILIVMVVGSIVAGNKTLISQAGATLFLAVLTLHGLGFALGYIGMRLLGYGEPECRTISVEVGMQNSGLGASLAKLHFASLPSAPVPAAISAVVHCLIGSALAGVWGRNSTKR